MSGNIRFIPDLRKKILSVVTTLNDQNNWGLEAIGADIAWRHSLGEGVKIAVIDTGWFPHKDLISNFVEGYDATGNNNYLDNGNGHSTHVSGIIAANCGNNIGVKGVAPMAKIIPIKALDDSGVGSFDFIAKALQIAKDLDVDIINMSLGSPIDPEDDSVLVAIREVTKQGKIVVCAAGNDGGGVNFPAKYDEVIAVAATEKSGNLAKFSSRGPELDVAAPGVQIYSTWLNDQYIMLDGTSMACPCISGIIALIIGWYKKHPELNFQIDTPNMIKLLFNLGGSNIISTGDFNIGVPKFCNFSEWEIDSL